MTRPNVSLRYSAESGGYTVLMGGKFIGRVSRTYEHSNGRTYRSWSAFPAGNKRGTFHHRTRAAAGQYLRRTLEESTPPGPQP